MLNTKMSVVRGVKNAFFLKSQMWSKLAESAGLISSPSFRHRRFVTPYPHPLCLSPGATRDRWVYVVHV